MEISKINVNGTPYDIQDSRVNASSIAAMLDAANYVPSAAPGGTTYSAGTGISISNGEISVDNSVYTTSNLSFNSTPSSSNKIATMNDIPQSLPSNGGNAATVGGHTVLSDVPANAVFTDYNTTYQFEQDGNTLKMGTDNGTKSAIYTPSFSAPVTSVAGKTGAVTLAKSDVGLGNVDNTADASKSVLYAATAGSAPASDVSSWAKAANKPEYAYSEIGYTVTPVTASSTTISLNGATPVHVVSFSSAITGVTLSTNPDAGHSCHVFFVNTSASDLTVDITHDSIDRVCPEATTLQLTVKAGGYGEVDFLSANNKVYVRGV